jgi:Ca-activated chloride channel family protein
MTFAHPWLLLLLLLLPLAAWLKGRRGPATAFLYSSVKLATGLTNPTRSRAGTFLAAMQWLALALFILALAQPRRDRSETKVTASGVDIVVVFDMSMSMLSEDFEMRGGRINRFEMARKVLSEFIAKRPNDRIGLVVFGTQAYIATPLTLDHDFLLSNIDRLQLGNIDGNQTAIGSGLSTGLNRLRDLKSKSKLVILMTDGVSNAGKISPLTAADAARALGAKVYTIGVGMRGEAPMPVFMGGQKVGYQPQAVDIDEDSLTEIAKRTGGKYYRADNTEKFKAIYAEIDKLEKTEATIKKYAHYDELFAWVLLPGLLLLLAKIILEQTVWRRLP